MIVQSGNVQQIFLRVSVRPVVVVEKEAEVKDCSTCKWDGMQMYFQSG